MTVGVALVGLGDIGLHAHLPALLRAPGVRVAAMVDPLPERRELAARGLPGVPVHADLDDVLADPEITGVVLATPPWVTPELATRALRTGRYVLAEKPLGVSLAAARRLAELPDEQVARLQVGLTYRHHPALAQLRDWLRADQLGSPVLVRAHIYDELRQPSDVDYAARIIGTLRHGPPVMHEGSHVFDWLSFLFDGQRPELADAWQLRTEPGLTTANLNGARLTYPNGTVAVLEFGWWTDRQPRCEVSVLGRSGYAVLDGTDFRLTLHCAEGDHVLEYPGPRMPRSFDAQLACFVDLMTGRTPHAMPGLAEGLASLEWSERVAVAAGKGGA